MYTVQCLCLRAVCAESRAEREREQREQSRGRSKKMKKMKKREERREKREERREKRAHMDSHTCKKPQANTNLLFHDPSF